MRFVLFYHSLISDWNHGNAHFLRGVASELLARGYAVRIFEPATGWSLQHLRKQAGETAVRAFQRAYPQLESSLYDLQTLDLDSALDGADVVIVHEWNDPQLVRNIGLHRARCSQRYRLLFHDTHHRAVSAPAELLRFDLSHYDGVLAFGEVLRRIYEDRAWAARAWTWHEAADTRVFRPTDPETTQRLDLVWVGNWGEGERAAELTEFLLEPVRRLGLRARIYGVRYPAAALSKLREANVDYAGWLANFRVPAVFAQSNCTVHVPRRYYTMMLPGIPTIRMFEALACAIPLVSAPWEDCEGLFKPGTDFLVARTGAEMEAHLQLLRNDPVAARELAVAGYRTIQHRHTCSHRVDELLAICRELGAARTSLQEAV
ncbi:MAG TPA: glycosyltransferase [Steroidobacteraceae bacterium]